MTVDPQPLPNPERLLATVLYVGIPGYSVMVDQFDSEQIYQLTGALWDEFNRVVLEHGGLVVNQLGDSLVLAWGAPEGCEDDAERGVSTSLQLHQALTRFKEKADHPAARALRLQIGVHTGLVLAGKLGARGDYTVMGDTVNVARLLEESAQPGEILISEATYQSIRGAFQVKRLTPVQLRGTQALINVFEILDELPQPTKLRYRSRGGLVTNLVARDQEMDRLAEIYQKTLSESKTQLALVSGDVGLGKSRLLFEFAGQLETRNPLLTVMSSRALDQTSRIPYFLWKELWANRFALNEDDPPDAAQNKTIEGVRAFWGRALGEITAVEAAHFLGSLIGVHWDESPYLKAYLDQPAERVQRSYLMLEELFFRASQRGPVVLILDDLHWADNGSLALIHHLWKSAQREMPLLILAGTRQEFLVREGQKFQDAELIELGALPVNPDLVRQAYPVLKNEADRLLALLAEKSGGNPYFLEEMVKNIVVSGEVDESRIWRLPDRLEDLLKMRLDSLSLEGRATAYFAAVSGRVFWKGSVLAAFRGAPGVTQALDVSSLNIVGKVGKALDEMMQKELAFLRVGSAFSGDREYIFKHGLLQQVAYNRLPDDLKMECHRAVALWLAERAGPERSITVAEHFEKAGVLDQAQVYYTAAAEQARAMGDDQEADDIQYYARTLH